MATFPAHVNTRIIPVTLNFKLFYLLKSNMLVTELKILLLKSQVTMYQLYWLRYSLFNS